MFSQELQPVTATDDAIVLPEMDTSAASSPRGHVVDANVDVLGSTLPTEQPDTSSSPQRESASDERNFATSHQLEAVEPMALSWDGIREWRDRPGHARRLAIDQLVRKPRAVQHDFAFLCRQETSNGIFEGDHCIATTTGVTTTAAGKSIAMQSFDPDHMFGIVQDGTDLIYEGELRVNVPHGYGVGCYATGDRFEGIWAQGRPCGLGRLTSALPPTASQYGWIYGTTVVYAWEKRLVDVPLPPPPRDQPLRGLYVMCKRLEIARLHQFRQVMDQWVAAICTQSVATAIHSRTIAFGAWAQACVAQQASIRKDGLQLHSQDTNDDLFNKVKEFIAVQATIHDKNELRRARLHHASLLNTTTVACLGIERRSTELVQADLDAVELELEDAKAAEQRCIAIQEEYAGIRRRIEEGKVKLNKMKQARRPVASVRKPSLLPSRRRSSTKVYVDDRHEDYAGVRYVCGVEGCDCHVDKTVFHPGGDPVFDD